MHRYFPPIPQKKKLVYSTWTKQIAHWLIHTHFFCLPCLPTLFFVCLLVFFPFTSLNICLFCNTVDSLFFFCILPLSEGNAHEYSPDSSSKRKEKKEAEEPTYNVAGSSTDTPPPLHMTLIIENLLQQWQPESITTNSCP